MANERQIVAFEASLQRAQEMIDRIRLQLDDHLELAPDDVTWADAGTAMKIECDVQNLSDFIFNEGEYAQ